MKFVKICGVMGMASFTEEQALIHQEFRHLKSVFQRLKETFFMESTDFNELSMGMTSDYQIAIEEGSTIVRIGTMIFGSR